MNISDWPLGKIMALPDYVFGRRFIIFCGLGSSTTGDYWDISEVAFPETAVIWEALMYNPRGAVAGNFFRVALGDQLPTTTGQMDGLEPLFNGVGNQGPGPREIQAVEDGPIIMRRLKFPVQAAGRRLVVEEHIAGPGTGMCYVALTVSGMPKEIPDCLNLV